MTIDPQFLQLMPSIVTWYQKSSRDAYGKGSFAATGTAVRCRIQQSSKMSRDSEGKEVNEIGSVYVYGVSTITVDDKLVMPDGKVAVVLTVETRNDESGPHHTVIRIGQG